MSHHWPPGEGPIDDVQAEKAKAKAEREKPEHAYRRGRNGEPDPRDKAGDVGDPRGRGNHEEG